MIKKACLFTTFAFVVGATAACKDATRWISAYGFAPIMPASTLMQPGAMIMKKKFGGAKAVRIVCDAPNSLGAGFRPSQSKTITGKFSRSRKVGWHIDADALQQIHVANKSDVVNDVYVEVLNARVVTLNDTDLLQNVGNRSRACQAAIAWRQQNGYDVSLISSALIADVSYSVSYKKDAALDATAKLAQMQQVAVTLGGNIESVTQDAAKATGLVWGVQDSSFLAAIGVDKAMPMTMAETKALRRKSLLTSEDVLSANAVTAPPPLSEGQLAQEADMGGAPPSAIDADPVPPASPEAAEDAPQAPPGQGQAAAPPSGEAEAVQGDTEAPRPRSPRARGRAGT